MVLEASSTVGGGGVCTWSSFLVKGEPIKLHDQQFAKERCVKTCM